MSAGVIQVQQSTIRDYTRQLHLPTVGGQLHIIDTGDEVVPVPADAGRKVPAASPLIRWDVIIPKVQS